MTVTSTDVLVVGAGPGGSACAYHLARRGVDVLLVDKSVFPREKVCGDGITPYGVRAIERMGIDPTEAGFLQIEGLRSYGVDYPSVRDPENDVPRRYGATGVPETFFLTRA